MTIAINPNNLEIFIAREKDLKNLTFDCGDEDLNEFILKDALINIEANLNIL